VSDTRSLEPPPEFGSDGSDPPRRSAPVVIAEDVFVVDPETPRDTGGLAARTQTLWTQASRRLRPNSLERITADLRAEIALSEWRQLVYSQRWQREEVVQVAPGAKIEHRSTVKTGFELNLADDLSWSLGLHTAGPAQLAASLGAKLGLSLTLTEERTETSGVTLVNDLRDRYRRFAIWRVVHRFDVRPFQLRPPSEPPPPAMKTFETVDPGPASTTSWPRPRRAT
jgi:hypothetical protein